MSMDKGKLYDQEESQRKKVIDLGQVAHHVLILKAVGLLGGKTSSFSSNRISVTNQIIIKLIC